MYFQRILKCLNHRGRLLNIVKEVNLNKSWHLSRFYSGLLSSFIFINSKRYVLFLPRTKDTQPKERKIAGTTFLSKVQVELRFKTIDARFPNLTSVLLIQVQTPTSFISLFKPHHYLGLWRLLHSSLYQSVFSREIEPMGYTERFLRRGPLQELADTIMEAKKAHGLPSARWRPEEAGGSVLVHV